MTELAIQEKNLHKRKEPRFKTCGSLPLRCNVFVEFDDPIVGTVVDISSGGLRMLCPGVHQPGTPFVAELVTDGLHGVYSGIIRRVAPWVDGMSVLGCQLLDPIPHEVLHELASQKVIDRRRDSRMPWSQSARMAWELSDGSIFIDIRDCSLGGLKIFSPERVPDDTQVRIFVDGDESEQMILDARAVWQIETLDGYLAGLAFTMREVPEAIVRIMDEHERGEVQPLEPPKRTLMDHNLLILIVLMVFGLAGLLAALLFV